MKTSQVLNIILFCVCIASFSSKMLLKQPAPSQNTCEPYLNKESFNLTQTPKWTCFDDQWMLQSPGVGQIHFKAKGNDWYLGIFDKKFDSRPIYNIIFAGWSNTSTSVVDKEGNVLEGCKVKNSIETDKKYDYTVLFDGNNNRIKVTADGKLIIDCSDKSGWKATNAKYFSFSCYCQGPSTHFVTLYNLKKEVVPEKSACGSKKQA